MTLVEFIRAWPDTWPHPDECVTQDYHDKDYSLGWSFGKDKMVSISIAQSGDIEWEAKVGENSFAGKHEKAKEIPPQLIEIFHQLGY